MLFIQLFLVFLSITLSNTVWIRDEFLVCEKKSEISNMIDFCQQSFLYEETCTEIITNLKKESNKYSIINYEKKKAVYSNENKIYETKCETVTEFYLVDSYSCFNGIMGNYSLNNKEFIGFIHDNGIIVNEIEFDKKFCTMSTEYTSFNNKTVLKKINNRIEIFNRDKNSEFGWLSFLVSPIVHNFFAMIPMLLEPIILMILLIPKKSRKLSQGKQQSISFEKSSAPLVNCTIALNPENSSSLEEPKKKNNVRTNNENKSIYTIPALMG
jgi:hypothetical protein